jgi:hypothetical protein
VHLRLAKPLLLVISTLFCLGLANLALWALNLADVEVYNHDPGFGYVTKPDQWPSPRGIVFRINRAGLRGADFSPTKEPSTLRIAFIGDSVTFGGGIVPDAGTFVSLSAARLSEISGRKLDTVNISSPGWGIVNMARYIDRHHVYGADVAVWVLPREDFHRPMSWAEGMYYRKPAFRLTFLADLTFERVKVAWGKIAGNLRPESSKNTSWPLDPLQQNVRTFAHALQLIRSNGARTIVVFFPEGPTPADSDSSAYAQFRAAAESARAEICDISPQVAADGGAALFYDGVHLNRLGHRVTGRLVAECLSRSEPSLFKVATTRK